MCSKTLPEHSYITVIDSSIAEHTETGLHGAGADAIDTLSPTKPSSILLVRSLGLYFLVSGSYAARRLLGAPRSALDKITD